jgi:3-hydroxyacyl-CoA dehydrogenase
MRSGALEWLESLEDGGLKKLVRGAGDLREALEGADYVQESIPEIQSVKRALYEAIDVSADDATIFGSSTSTLPGSEFLTGLGISSRCLVVHPVNPPHLIPVVELCRTPETDDRVFSQLWEFLRACGQEPVELSKEIFGFALNRLQGALVREALNLIEEEAISPTDIDLVVRRGLGLRWALMGPFETGHLNAPGGYAEYMGKFHSPWETLFAAIGRPMSIDPALIERIDSAIRSQSDESISQRQANRDVRLEKLRSFLEQDSNRTERR